LQGTGVTDTGILLTKRFIWKSLGINAIVVKISVWVNVPEKNKDICNDVLLLKDFMLCATYGEDVLQSDATYACTL
jgi:hypothetical protein